MSMMGRRGRNGRHRSVELMMAATQEQGIAEQPEAESPAPIEVPALDELYAGAGEHEAERPRYPRQRPPLETPITFAQPLPREEAEADPEGEGEEPADWQGQAADETAEADAPEEPAEADWQAQAGDEAAEADAAEGAPEEAAQADWQTQAADEAAEADAAEKDAGEASAPVEIDNHFFDGTSRPSAPMLETEEHDERARLKATPAVAHRRRELTRYVKVAVAASSALCLAALVKIAVARSATDNESRAAIAQPSASGPSAPFKTAVAPVLPAPAAQPTPPQPVQASVPAASVSAQPAVAPVASVASVPSAASTEATATASSAPATPDPDPKAAAKEKRACQSALERGKLADAIEAGERSVTLDPTDAEAWLLLGASYQAKGDMKNERRAFKACLDEGKRGPKYECLQMPH